MKLVRSKDLKKRLRQLAKMEIKGVIRYGLSYLHVQIKIRPRVKFIVFLVTSLILAYLFSMEAVSTLRAKESEIKINGQAILVAEKPEESTKPEVEISQLITPKRSPFDFQRPVEAGYISQGYRSYHRAIDIATSLGSPIHPLGSGKVEFAGRATNGKGNIVIINHGNGLKSLYAHMGRITVGVEDGVDSKAIIGTVGLTGRTTGAHVHLEIYDNDNMVDPESVLPVE